MGKSWSLCKLLCYVRIALLAKKIQLFIIGSIKECAHDLDKFAVKTFGGRICLRVVGGCTEVLHPHFREQFVC